MIGLLAAFKANRKILTLILALGVAAAFYVQWQVAALDRSYARTERAQLLAFSDGICASMGVTVPAPDAPTKARGDFAASCRAQANRLGRVEGDLARGTADSLLAGLDERMGKEAADALLAAAYAKRAADTADRLESANAQVQNDVATGAWASAINDAAGLR